MKGSQRSCVYGTPSARQPLGIALWRLCGFAAVAALLWQTAGCGDFKLPKASEIANEITGKDEEKKEAKQPVASQTPAADPVANSSTPKPGPANVSLTPTPEPAQAASPEQVLAELEGKQFKIANDDDLQRLVDGMGDQTDLVTILNMEGAQVTPEGMKLLEHFTKLKDLNLAAVSLPAPAWEPLSKLVELEKLNLERSAIDNAGIVHIRGLVHLKDLNLKRTTQLSDEGHYNLDRMRELERLDISANPTIKGGGFLNVRQKGSMPGLRELIANNTQFGQDGMGGVDGLKSLEVLDIGKTGTTNLGLGALRKCPQIKRLMLGQNRSINDVGMVELARLKQLEYIILFNLEGVTNQGLSNIKGAKQLEFVEVTGTRVNDEGMRALKKLIPKVKIKKDNKVIE